MYAGLLSQFHDFRLEGVLFMATERIGFFTQFLSFHLAAFLVKKQKTQAMSTKQEKIIEGASARLTS